jgi:broad specificity phosphatase PhoE
MKLYLVRHGQTIDAENNIKQRTNSNLSETGRVQAKRTGRLIKDKGIEIIISSPWIRAKETAEIINMTLKKQIVFEELYREKLQSQTLGGRSNDDGEAVRYANEHEKNFCDPRWKFDQTGESTAEAFERVKVIEKTLRSKYFNKTVLIVSHADFLRCLICYLIIGDNFESEEFKKLFRSLSFKNGGITYIYYDEKRLFWRLGNFD